MHFDILCMLYIVFLIHLVISYLMYVGSRRGVGGCVMGSVFWKCVCCGVLSDGSLV